MPGRDFNGYLSDGVDQRWQVTLIILAAAEDGMQQEASLCVFDPEDMATLESINIRSPLTDST